MALSFTELNGSAKKSKLDYYKLVEGKNVFRIIGDVLPRYVYWPKNGENKTKAFECLGFDREKERFTNIERDYVQEMVKVLNTQTQEMEPIKCSWSYACQVVLPDGSVQVLNLRKKMFESIIDLSKKLGDPTDPDTGYDIIVERVKTGPKAYNVEYRLDVVSMMTNGKRPLNEAEREALDNLKPMGEIIPRPTPEDQLKELEKFLRGEEEEAAKTDDSAVEAAADLD